MLQDSGSKIDENLSSIIVGLVNFFSTFLATVFIDKLGRKVLLFVSAGTMTLMLGVLGAFFYFKNSNYDVSDYGFIPLLSFVTFVLGFSAGFGPIPWLMMGEILPGKYFACKCFVKLVIKITLSFRYLFLFSTYSWFSGLFSYGVQLVVYVCSNEDVYKSKRVDRIFWSVLVVRRYLFWQYDIRSIMRTGNAR